MTLCRVPWLPTASDVLLYNATCRWSFYIGTVFAYRVAMMSIRQTVKLRGEPVPIRILVAGDYARASKQG